ncbi:MAG TPA: HEAT repeat domain-containing protein, partial [Kiritimatiellia bacterium]
MLQSQADLPLMQFALARVKEFSRDERSISLGPLCLTVLQQGPDGFIADERPEMRSMALGVLAAQLDRPPAETLPHLVAALNDPDDKVVHVAWDLLHGQGARALPYLVLGLDSSDSFIGSQCTELIRQLGLDGREAVPALLKRLDDPDWSTRWATVRALGEAGATDGAAVAGLRRAVADPHPSVSKEARAILDRIVKEHPEALVASAPKAGPLKIVLIVRSDGALDDVLPHAASTLNDGIVSRLRDIEASVEAVIVPGAPSYDDAALRILGKKHGAMAVAVLQPRFV